MTEELLLLYKELYKNGGVLYRVGKDKRLTIVFREQPKLYSQHQFPEYEYSKAYAMKLLRKLRWVIAITADKVIAA